MLPKQNKLWLLPACLVIFLAGFAGKPAGDPVINKLLAYKKLLEKHPVEKIHIHTDKPAYTNYDTIWFKAYVADVLLNHPSFASKILYTELLNGRGKIVRSAKLPMMAGLASGWFILGDSMRTGNYRIRAYTSQMKAYGGSLYYEKWLALKNRKGMAATPLTNLKTAKLPADTLQFFAESGDLINGISSVVAFKALQANGLGTDVSGTVEDDQGNKLLSFASAHLGMGVFNLTPQPGRKYYARVAFKDGYTARVQLPTALPQGYTMQLEHQADSIHIIVKGSDGVLGSGALTLVASQQGVTRYITQFPLTTPVFNRLAAGANFLTGVAQFTLFDANGIALAERLVYIDRKDELNVMAGINASYARRAPVKLPLNLKNAEGKPEVGSLSVSVYNNSENLLPEDDEASIYTDMLLTADLKGNVEQPNYYFSKPHDAERLKQLDNLLLTQGWRRFSWRDVLAKGLPEVTEEAEDGLQITGIIKQKKQPYAGGDVSLFKAGSLKNIWQTKTDSAGRFTFADLRFADTARFAVTINASAERKNYDIQVAPDKPLNIPGADITSTVAMVTMPYITARGIPENEALDMSWLNSKTTLLKEVKITAKPILVKESANLNGPGRADAIVTAKQLETVVDLKRYLTSYVSGLTIGGDPQSPSVYARQGLIDATTVPPPTPMSIVLDGMPVGTDLSRVDIQNIETIEVLKSGGLTAMYGIDGLGGILVVTTKRGRDYTAAELARNSPGILPVTLTGYQPYREMYQPVYKPNEAVSTAKPDFRKTLYWNPNVLTNEKGQAELSFYNSDYIGPCKVVIEGINADGQIVRAVYHYEVK